MAASRPSVSPEHVRDALEHLYENVPLARSPLAELLPDVAAQQDPEARAQVLRRDLLNAIERLRPARPTSFTDHAARSYQVLSLLYLEEMSVRQVAEELGVGERQAYRELRRAEGELASVIESFTGGRHLSSSPDSLEQELHRFVSQPRRLELRDLVAGVANSMAPMAALRGVAIEIGDLCQAAVVADEGLLRQLLTQLVSLALQGANGGSLVIASRLDPGSVELSLRFAAVRLVAPELLQPTERLAEVQNARLSVGSPVRGVVTMRVLLKVVEPRVALVVEDNEGAAELYRRYLAGMPEWQVTVVSDPRICVDMATRLRPAAVVLDIMMPQRDGWTVLQSLRAHEETASTPVVICSVFHDPGLAQALGATGCLKKPVSRLEFLGALERCLESPNRG